jgi:predicted transcriptional regulator
MNKPTRPTAAEIVSEVQHLVAIALATPKEVADVFVDWSAHVNCVHVNVHAHGWREGAEAILADDCYTDGDNAHAKLLVLRQRLEARLYDLATVSEKERAAIKAKAIRDRATKLMAEADAIEGSANAETCVAPTPEALPSAPTLETRDAVAANSSEVLASL